MLFFCVHKSLSKQRKKVIMFLDEGLTGRFDDTAIAVEAVYCNNITKLTL